MIDGKALKRSVSENLVTCGSRSGGKERGLLLSAIIYEYIYTRLRNTLLIDKHEVVVKFRESAKQLTRSGMVVLYLNLIGSGVMNVVCARHYSSRLSIHLTLFTNKHLAQPGADRSS